MSNDVVKIINSVGKAVSQQNAVGYLYGNLIKHHYTSNSQSLRDNVIDIIISYKNDFDVSKLYSSLIKDLTINSEIKNTEYQYHILSDGYIIRFELEKNFDPKSLEKVKKYARFSIDSIFQEINTKNIYDYSDHGVDHLKSENILIKSIIDHNEWELKDYLDFAVRFSEFENSVVDKDQLNILKSKNITDFRASNDDILSVLLSYEPGKAIDFIKKTFKNGDDWIFSTLVEFMSNINVPMKENLTKEIFSEKKLQLANVYSKFYLIDKFRSETPDERTKRLHTTLRLIFDSPSLNIEIPYIDSVSIITSSSLSDNKNSFKALALDDFCPYGICPQCEPENCNPQCCCCSSVDMIRQARTRCHKQVTLSCAANSSGDILGFDIPPYEASDPHQGEFPPGSEGVIACETVLAIRDGDPRASPSYCENWEAVGASELWWSIPSINWPCQCNCASNLPGAPNDCQLTCVTCDDKYCNSSISVSGHDCFYNIELQPGAGCCGSPAVTDWMFVIDFSGSMSGEINQVRDEVDLLVDKLAATGIDIRVGLVTFGDTDTPVLRLPLTDDIDLFKSVLDSLSVSGGSEYDIEAAYFAAISAEWRGHANFMVLVADEPTQYRDGSCNESNCLDKTKTVCDWFNITVYSVDELSAARQELVDYTNGRRFEILEPFSDLVDSLNIAVYPTSCKCVDYTPVPITKDLPECRCDSFDYDCFNNLPSHCYDIPINICYPGQQCNCTLPIDLYACGHTIVVNSGVIDQPNLVCCSDLNGFYGLGCDCRQCNDQVQCCGPECFNICEEFPNDQFPWGSESGRRAIVDSIWLDCWDKKAAVDSLFPNCTHPCCPDGSNPGDRNFPCSRLRNPSEPSCQGDMRDECLSLLNQGNCCECRDLDSCCNCCLQFSDENCELSIRHCFNDIKNRTYNYITNTCLTGNQTQPPIDWEPPTGTTTQLADRCIVGEPEIDPSDRESINNQCENPHRGCSPVKHPSVVVLNNGIGLVAYERLDKQISEIRIQQFKTTVKEKIMPNREFDFGRLQNVSKWTTQSGELYKSAKLYYYGQVPQQIINSNESADPEDPDSWGDTLVFKNGPLEKQFFPLAPNPLGTDTTGNYLRFFMPSDTELSNPFNSSDDAYDIKFFILDSEDSIDNNKGFIGDSEDSTSDGASYIFSDRRQVDEELLKLTHIYNGERVPVAYPSLATAYNYSDGLENAHWVYLSYQALEDNKWNVYLRQIRLSEYSMQQQIDDAITSSDLVSLVDLNITEVVLRVFCLSDNCSGAGDGRYLISRTVVFEVLTKDGREVLSSPDVSGNWQSLCPGYLSGDFDKSKIFVQFVHSAICDRCPDQFGFNDIFYNWRVGQEYITPSESLSGPSLFSLLSIDGDSSIDIGTFSLEISVSGVNISNSSVSAIYYQNSNDTSWSVISNASLNTLSQFKGMDIGEPICLTKDEQGHSTRPVIKVNYNNDVFVAYESTESTKTKIKIRATSIPTSSLPVGIFEPKNLDATVNLFFGPVDFIYEYTVTEDGMNQSPDMFIDLNDVLHLTWQSNRDNRWEIYYANSDNNFSEKRITNHKGKSLRPKIHGDDNGRLYITWHDDRYGNYEVMMAYYLGSRVIPLTQQDPYLASIRNSGYSHYLNEVNFVLSNQTGFPVCYNDVIVDFYSERTLEEIDFSVSLSDYSFAFNIPDSQNDQTTKSYLSFVDWTNTPTVDGEMIESPEYDSSLNGSYVSQININYELFEIRDSLVISFKASDRENDSTSSWTDFVPISSNVQTNYSSLNISDTRGRYKKIRIKFVYSSGPATISSLSVVSESRHRICLAPNSEAIGTLDLTPSIRVDSTGTSNAEFPIPIGFARNNTYFVGIRAIDEDGNIVEMPDQKSSVSCESCSNSQSTWNNSSCSLKFEVTNTNQDQMSYNFRVSIYHDPERRHKISEFLAFSGRSELEYFTVDGKNATSEWTDDGLRVDPNITRQIIFWPTLSQNTGLICGVSYYMSIDYSIKSIEEQSSIDDLVNLQNTSWICNCQSLRWDAQSEENPVNIRDLVRWKSSGDGGSDTRITETFSGNSLNPNIRIRSNLNGVIVYESNRKELQESNYDSRVYRIYASVFSIIPKSGMYSTASQNINTGFESIVFRSDIPICKTESDSDCDTETLPCDSCYENGKRKNSDSFLRGQNVSLDIDPFDAIFMAFEVPFKDSINKIECNEFVKDKQQYISVRSAGANVVDLFRNIDENTNVNQECNPSEILGKTYSGSSDSLFRSIVIEIRVKNNKVKYHITRDGLLMAVVNECLVDLEVVAIPETMAIRLRNESGEWGEWIPFHPEIGDNTISINNWRLSSGSGIKNVQFEAATHTGISQTGSLSVLADYVRVPYEVRFYRPLEDSPIPSDNKTLSELVADEDIWVESNKLNIFNGIPVAALRPPTLINNTISVPENDYIFIEIEPGRDYVESVNILADDPVVIFDFIQQGGRNDFNIPTVLYEQAGRLLFRGVIQINRDNQAAFLDGLASIVPHFSNDCSESVSLKTVESSFERDYLNQIVSEKAKETENDVFERDSDGRVKYKTSIRPSEDPYLIFGDPNYRLSQNE